jgi:uncharacterized protein
MEPDVNVVGGQLLPCSTDPVTGFYRNGCCSTGPEDLGSHTVCVVLTAEFLEFSKQAGNDLSTPRPEWGFPGLKPGDRWCLCASRWLEASRRSCSARRTRARSTSCRSSFSRAARPLPRPRRRPDKLFSQVAVTCVARPIACVGVLVYVRGLTESWRE